MEVPKSWNEESCCIGWDGMECDYRTNHVVKVELGKKRIEWNETIVMHKTMSPSLTKLEFLEVLTYSKQLYLENIKLAGIIPLSLGNLHQFQTLSLKK